MPTEQQALTEWLNSPTHRKNIEDPNYTRTCIESDVAADEKGVPNNYVVQEFASF
jgi:uncharacterized protein YkwD